MSNEGAYSYYTFIESSLHRYYKGTFDAFYGVSLEASKAASSAWRTLLSYESITRPTNMTNGKERYSTLFLNALNRGPSLSSGFNLASRSIHALKDLTSFRFSRSNNHWLPSSPSGATIHAKSLSVPMGHNGHPDLEPIVSPSMKRRLNKNETAYLIAMGTLYTLRDVALSEAFDLHESLRFWLERLENPILSFIEAGPFIWF